MPETIVKLLAGLPELTWSWLCAGTLADTMLTLSTLFAFASISWWSTSLSEKMSLLHVLVRTFSSNWPTNVRQLLNHDWGKSASSDAVGVKTAIIVLKHCATVVGGVMTPRVEILVILVSAVVTVLTASPSLAVAVSPVSHQRDINNRSASHLWM